MRTWLKEIREKSGRPQEDIAQECGLTRQAISAYETGKAVPSISAAKKIAAALNFDWQRFYEEG